jgi:uncharacterized protein YoaH (UPF0181 family)
MTNLPTKLSTLLQRLFQQQAAEVMSRVRVDGDAPDLTPWIKATADACRPLMLAMWQQGITNASAKLAARITTGKPDARMPEAPRPKEEPRRVPLGNDAIFGVMQPPQAKALQDYARTLRRGGQSNDQLVLRRVGRHIVCKASGSGPARVDLSFDLFNPKVLRAVDEATFRFCQETLDTATMDLNQALDELRLLMREGLSKGDAVALLARKVRSIFADPYRAFRIATTEGSRAVHGGQMLLAHEAGVRRHSWLASSDACEHCLELDGKTVELGQPFHVDQRGGPYAVTLHPPLHPFCFCSTVEEIA